MKRIAVQDWPATLAPVHVSRLPEILLERVTCEISSLCAPVCLWQPMVLGLVTILDMNPVEVVAWLQVLRKALIGERPEGHLRAVQFSAYLTKSILASASLETAWGSQSLSFKCDYDIWLSTHSHCGIISKKHLYMQFYSCSLPGQQQKRSTLNSVVDTLIAVPAEEELQPAESTYRLPIFPLLSVPSIPPPTPLD